MTDYQQAQALPKPATADPALRRFNILIGTWDLTGHTLNSEEDNITGRTTFEWMPGGFFLQSTGEMTFMGATFQSLEIIGYDPATQTFPSSVYSSMDGNVMPYHWDVQGNIVTHWDATSKYTGTLSEDGNALTGGWRPNTGEAEAAGNAYDAVMTRVK